MSTIPSDSIVYKNIVYLSRKIFLKFRHKVGAGEAGREGFGKF
jgi:hypothetical protein